MSTPADFENHGIFPFINREDELRRLMQFWRGEGFGAGVRVMHMTGEARVGKTRLLEELFRHVFFQDVRSVPDLSSIRERLVRFVPGADASLIPSIAHALGDPFARVDSRDPEVDPSFESVMGALEQLASKKLPLLVLEDLHLLSSDYYPVLVRLLKRLTPSRIAVLAVTRPMEAPGLLQILAAHDAFPMQLEGFPPEKCKCFWDAAFGVAPSHEVVMAVHMATRGNGGALYWALRGVLVAARKAHVDLTCGWNIPGRLEWLVKAMEDAVREPTLGLLMDDLTSEQQRGAAVLAQLGEVFSREAARTMVPDADALIDTLLFRGIVVTVQAPPRALPGVETSHAALSFTHSLHQYLAEDGAVAASGLIRVIAGCPMYTVRPFQLLAGRSWHAESLEPDVILRAFDRTFDALKAIDRSAEWKSTRLTWHTALRLMAVRLGAWSQNDWERMLVKVINYALTLALRDHHDQLERWLAMLKEVTAVASSDELAVGRLNALTFDDLVHSLGRPDVTRTLWQDAQALVDDRLYLQYRFAYVDFVIVACRSAYVNGDIDMMRCIRERANEILDADDMPDNVRAVFARKVRPPLLSLFVTEAELQTSLRLIRGYEDTIEPTDLDVWLFCIPILAEVAEAASLWRICDRVLPRWQELGMIEQCVDVIARRQMLKAGTETSFAAVAEPFQQAIAMIEPKRRAEIEQALARPLLEAALMRGEADQAVAVMSAYNMARADLCALCLALIAFNDADPITALAEARQRADAVHELAGMGIPFLLDLLLGDAGANDSTTEPMGWDRPILRLSDVSRVRLAVRLFDRLRRTRPADAWIPDAERKLRDAVLRAMNWLAAPTRGLFMFMCPLLEDARELGLLDDKQSTHWQRLIDKLAEDSLETSVRPEADKLRITLLGDISVTGPDVETGDELPGREQHTLATLGLVLLRGSSMSAEEFYMIAAPSAENLLRAKGSMKQSVLRLRDRFGRGMIVTKGGMYHLNKEVIEVDLLEVRRCLRRSMRALLEKSPLNAAIEFFKAMEHVVVYPEGDRTREPIRRNRLFASYDDSSVFGDERDLFEKELCDTASAVADALGHKNMHDDQAAVLKAVEMFCSKRKRGPKKS